MNIGDLSITAWLLEHQIRNEKGDLIDLKDHLFLYDIYNDFSQKLVCLKAAQIGFTTTAILKQFWATKHYGLDSIYTMPTQSDAYSVLVKGKVNRIISQNPILQQYVKDSDSIEQKQIGSNIAYYRGTFTEQEALAVTSDWNIHDEEDRSDQAVIAQYSSRTQHSKFAWEHHFSNPSVEGNGVSRYWAKSDQKHWFITCHACGKRQFLSWPESIDPERKCFQCKFCHIELTREDRRVGVWMKKKTEIVPEFSGYWISLLMAPWVTAPQILEFFETKPKDFFWNFVLGLPYVGEGNKVTPEMIYQNLTKTINRQENVVIGCDSGIVKHFVCGNEQGLFYAGKTESWGDIAKLLDRWEYSVAIIDAMPDITGPRELQERYPGRVYLVHYTRDRRTQEFLRWGKGEGEGTVLVDRNRTIQQIVDQFAIRGRIPLQGTRDDWSEYYSHWATMYRTTELDSLGVPVHVWNTSNGMDHWAHATVYWAVGMDRFGQQGGAAILGQSSPLPVRIGPEINLDNTAQITLPTGEDPVMATLEAMKEGDESDDWRDT